MLYAYVLGDRVAAPRAAAECERGAEHEVVNIAYAALRGGSVDEYAAGLHARGEFVELGFFPDGIKVDRRGVTVAAVGNEMLGFSEGILYISGTVHRKHGRELFMGKFLGKFYRFDFADEYLCTLGYLYAGERGNRSCLLTDDLCIQRAVYDDGLSHALGLERVKEITSARSKFGFNGVIYFVKNDNGLLGGAYHAVIKGL